MLARETHEQNGRHFTNYILQEEMWRVVTFSHAFSWKKMFVFWIEFHLSLFLRIRLTTSQHWSRQWIDTKKRQAITWTNDDPVFWHLYAPPGLNESKSSHCSDVMIRAMASQITGVSIVCSTVCSGADQRKHQSSASLAFLWGESTGDRWIPLTKGQ